jgi:hypothetical protein
MVEENGLKTILMEVSLDHVDLPILDDTRIIGDLDTPDGESLLDTEPEWIEVPGIYLALEFSDGTEWARTYRIPGDTRWEASVHPSGAMVLGLNILSQRLQAYSVIAIEPPSRTLNFDRFMAYILLEMYHRTLRALLVELS